MKLYFGNTTTTVTTVMILDLLGYISYSFINRANNSVLETQEPYFTGGWSCVLLFCSGAGRTGQDNQVRH